MDFLGEETGSRLLEVGITVMQISFVSVCPTEKSASLTVSRAIILVFREDINRTQMVYLKQLVIFK